MYAGADGRQSGLSRPEDPAIGAQCESVSPVRAGQQGATRSREGGNPEWQDSSWAGLERVMLPDIEHPGGKPVWVISWCDDTFATDPGLTLVPVL